MTRLQGEPDFSPLTVLVLFPDGPKYVPRSMDW